MDTHNEIKSTGAGSQRYGPCEVCGNNADIMYKKEVQGWSYYGHKKCLEMAIFQNRKPDSGRPQKPKLKHYIK